MHTQKLITKSKLLTIGVLEKAGGNWQKKKLLRVLLWVSEEGGAQSGG